MAQATTKVGLCEPPKAVTNSMTLHNLWTTNTIVLTSIYIHKFLIICNIRSIEYLTDKDKR